jgi:tetratricopeptide (TPR) repeat protein
MARLLRQIRAEWCLVLGMFCLFSLVLVWFSLRHPGYSASKAFYAFSALLPVSVLVAVGWDWLRQRNRVMGVTAWVLLLVWSMTVYTSFWVRSGNPQTQMLKCVQLASTLRHQGKLDEALYQYREAVSLTPGYADAHNNLGNVLGMKGQLDEAIIQYREATRLKPNHALAHHNLGMALAQKGQLDEAISQYQAAIGLKPDYADAFNNLGVAFGRKGRIDEAIIQLREVIRLNPDHADARNNLGLALDKKGQTDEAIRQFQEALRLKPDFAEARKNLDAVRAFKAKSLLPPGAATNR